ncbi:MAG: hypothetical protein HYT71_03190 [Candidatus Aenigmarchaeota archaeon]|nr:hypothetical protein [Candidatus Aenigmarchaeota archaeon]
MNKQSTFEGCLPVCLLKDSGIPISKTKELGLIVHSLKFNKFDYSIGNLDLFAGRYKRNLAMVVENKYYAKFLKSINKNGKIEILNEPVNVALINEYLKTGNVIVYLDCYYVGSKLHAPHFVMAMEMQKGKYKIFDPWDGKTKLIPVATISRGIKSLRNTLRYTPKLIQVVKT